MIDGCGYDLRDEEEKRDECEAVKTWEGESVFEGIREEACVVQCVAFETAQSILANLVCTCDDVTCHQRT
jgi:hypothetical protein